MKTLVTILCWFIPFKKTRKQLKQKYVKSVPIKYHHNNRIVIHLPDGKTIENPYSIPGLSIHFAGCDSVIELFYPINFHKSHFVCRDNCSVIIKPSCFMGLSFDMYNECTVTIDENCQIGQCHVNMPNERGTALYIERDCVFSTGIEIWTTDAHPISDMDGNCINNRKSCVTIGRHVWICRNATLLKGARIPTNSIIGNSAVVSTKLVTENSVYAGNPAICVKSNINWSKGKIS